MAYPHQKLIKRHGINTADLPGDIQEAISKFDALNIDMEDAEDDDEVTIKQQLSDLSAEISTEIKEHLDNEAEDDLSPGEIAENIIKDLLTNGQTTTTAKELKSLGYPFYDKIGLSYNKTHGKYRVTKHVGNNTIYLFKVS